MSLNFDDQTGKLPTVSDADEAVQAVRVAMLQHIMKLPPDLAVQLANIHRLLKVARAVIYAAESREHHD